MAAGEVCTCRKVCLRTLLMVEGPTWRKVCLRRTGSRVEGPTWRKVCLRRTGLRVEGPTWRKVCLRRTGSRVEGPTCRVLRGLRVLPGGRSVWGGPVRGRGRGSLPGPPGGPASRCGYSSRASAGTSSRSAWWSSARWPPRDSSPSGSPAMTRTCHSSA